MVAEKLTIVQVVPEMDEGGVEGETLDFAVYLAKRGHRSIVISGGGRLASQLERNGVSHIKWKNIGTKSLRCLKYIPQLRRFLVDERVDVLHLRSRLPAWIGFLAWKSLDSATRPALVTSFHGFYSVNSYSTIMTKGERVIAVSRVIQEHILNNYQVNPQDISLIHGGYDSDAFDPTGIDSNRMDMLKKKWDLLDDGRTIVMLPGRLTSWKGQDVFIDALVKIKDLSFVALCVGDTTENPAFTKKLRDKITGNGLSGKIKLVGHCEDMPAALAIADLVVSASSSQPEAFGKVAIEAMAMAKPIVATRHGGSLETVINGETGWLVEPSDSGDLADTLQKVLQDREDLKRIGSKGREWVQENFTALRMCEKTIELYRELIEEKSLRFKGSVLSVVQMLPELDSGGVERGTLEIGKYLAENNHRSYVISGGGRMVQQLIEEGSNHIQWNVGTKSPFTLRYVLRLRRFLKKEQIDVLHLRSRMPAWVGYFAWKSLPKRDRPVLVTTFHGFYSVNSYSAIMTKGTGIIAISKSIEQHIKEKYRIEKEINLIYRGVDKAVFDPEMVGKERIERFEKDWQIDSGKPVIILPGRLTRLKGQDIFIKALALMNNQNYQAVLIGDFEENPGFTDELLKIVSQNGLAGKVKMAGHCDDMPAALMLADIVVSASSREPEGFGRITIEAMAMGKAVIATAHGGSLETITQGINGWLVRPGDPEELAKALDNALAEPERMHEFGQVGKDLVSNQFTMTKMCEKTISLYQDLFAVYRSKEQREG